MTKIAPTNCFSVLFSSILWPTGDPTINSLGDLIVRSPVGHYIDENSTEKRLSDAISFQYYGRKVIAQ